MRRAERREKSEGRQAPANFWRCLDSSQTLLRYLDPDPNLLLEDINQSTNPKFNQLNRAVVSLIEDQNIVSFLPLDVTSEDSVNTVLSHIDNMMQYGEDEEPKVPKDMDDGEFVLSFVTKTRD